MTKTVAIWFFAFVSFLAFISFPAIAQTPTTPTPTPIATPAQTVSPTPPINLEKHFVKNIIRDQAVIWTTPFRLDKGDTRWLLPFTLGTAALVATDPHTSAWIDRNGGLPVFSHDVSWAGKAYVTGGVAAAFYLAGRATHNYRARETGILAAQALIDTGIVTEVLKVSTQRLRPSAENGTAEFWDGGSSFPSGHSSTVWSVATVIAYEYKDNPWIRYGAFAAATAVSLSRYSGRNHFLSDIVVGSAIGFGIGRHVFRTYHVDNPSPTGKPTTKLMPTFLPYYDGRTRTYGGSLVWRL